MLMLVLFGVMLVMFAIGVSIAAGMGLSAAAALLMLPRSGLEIVPQRMFLGLDSFVILSVPLFLLLGEVMERAQITGRLVEFAQSLVGRLRGGLAHVSVVTNMIMSGISGSGTADAAATAAVLMPAMRQARYPVPFSAALIGAGGTIGPIIPPSIVMVIYGSIANVSVARLFLAGIIPGIIMGGFLMATTALMARRKGLPPGQPTGGLPEIVRASKRASLVLVTPVIVIMGIAGGVFTATESAAIACLYALILGMLVYRTVKPGDLPDILLRTAIISGKVMFVFATASIFAWIMARANVPQQMASLPFLADTANPWMMLLALNILLFILGGPMDSVAIVVIVTPMFMPLALAAGIDPVHLGIVISVNVSLAMITPPVGSIIFVICGMTGVSTWDLSRELMLFIGVLLIPLLLFTYVPEVVLFLPDLLMGPANP